MTRRRDPRRAARFLAGAFAALALGLMTLRLLLTGPGLLYRAERRFLPDFPAERLRSFSGATAGYLSGRRPDWDVTEPEGGPPSEAFAAHMAQIRLLTRLLPAAALPLLGLALLLLWRSRGLRSLRGWTFGVLLPWLALLLPLLWMAADFGGFWQTLHRVLIPGGIFSASEKMMTYFPQEMFGLYGARFCVFWALETLALLLAPPLCGRIVDRKKARYEYPE